MKVAGFEPSVLGLGVGGSTTVLLGQTKHYDNFIVLSGVRYHEGEHDIIVSKSLSETTMCPQTFIVKTLIIRNINSHHICMKRKEGASEQDSGETERKRV